jgi:hypothetical protein
MLQIMMLMNMKYEKEILKSDGGAIVVMKFCYFPSSE